MDTRFKSMFAVFNLSSDLDTVIFSEDCNKAKLYSMIWVTEGMVDLVVDDVLIPMDVGQMIFITPLQKMSVKNNHGRIKVLQFNREFYCIKENDHEVSCNGILYFGAQGIPLINLNAKEIKSFLRLALVLEEEFEIVDTIQEEMLRSILKKWLIKCTRILKTQKIFIGDGEGKTELIRNFRILVEKNYKSLHKVSQYAALLNKSPKTITNQFKLQGLESPSCMIQQRIIVEAKRYLMYSHLSIKEISANLGFEDPPSFSNYFKKRTTVSPSIFRNVYRKK